MKIKQLKKLGDDFIKEYFRYDPDDGHIYLKKDLLSRKKGQRVDIKCGDYNSVKYTRKYECRAHTLAWFLHEGYWPEHQIDHGDGNGHNNKFYNIDHVTQMCNSKNRKLNSNNTSGFPGVFKIKERNKYVCRIQHNGKRLYLLLDDDPLNCALARFDFEINCPDWKCNKRSMIYQTIKKVWPEFDPFLKNKQ